MQATRASRPVVRWIAHSCIALLGLFATLSVAHAQAPPLPGAPPVFSTVDDNGVNLASGTLDLAMEDVSVGQAGGLSFVRFWVGTGWRYNHIGTINSSGAVYTVSIGASSETFTLVGGTYDSDQKMGSTLTLASNIYTYTMRDGTIARFDTTLANGGMVFDANVARLIDITTPSGERLTYTYKQVTAQSVAAMRLQSVTNNRGYQLHLGYALNNPTLSSQLTAWKTLTSVTAINNAVEYCAPSNDTCSLSNSWPSVSYSVSGAYETITDPLGRGTRITYDGSNRITAIRRPTSTTSDQIWYTYSSGRISQVNSWGGGWTYSYSSSGGSVTTTRGDGLANQIVVVNATTGLVSSITADGATMSYQYDADDRLTETKLGGNGPTTQFTLDGRGNVTTTTRIAETGSGLSNIVTSASYPASCSNPVTCNQPTSTTDANGNVTDYTYDSAHGGVLTVTLPDPDGGGPAPRPQSRFGYSSRYAYYYQGGGSVAAAPTPITLLESSSACATTSSCAGGADETVSSTSFGSTGVANNLQATATSAGAGDGSLAASQSFTYDNVGNLLTVDGPLSGSADTTRYRYNADRELIGVVGPDPDGAGGRDHPATRLTYNLDGQVTQTERGTVTSQSDPAWAAFSSLQQQNTTYDFNGLPVMVTTTAGGTTFSAMQLNYYSNRLPQCVAVRMNPAIFGSLPSSACTLGTEGANGPDRITRYTYLSQSRPATAVQAYGTSDATTVWTATYNSHRQVATLADAAGNLLTYEYDGFDRLRKIRFPNTSGGGSSTTDYEQYSYDTSGNPSDLLVQNRRRDGATLSYTYDALNRLTATNASDATPDINYAYDNFSRVTEIETASQTLNYAYDQLSRLLSEAQPRGTMSYQWDLAGRRTRVTWPDALYVAYDYDLSNALTAVRENGASSGAGVLATYTYDALGRRTGVSRGNGTTETAVFDGVSRLIELSQNLSGSGSDVTFEYAYDAASGITSREASNSAYDWSPSADEIDYASNGLNQYTSVDGAAQSYDARGNLTTGSFGYDIFNRLTSGPSSATLAYDPSGRLYETVGGGTTTRFIYDGLQIVGEYNASNVLQRRYVPGAALDETVAWLEGASNTDRRWLAADERGSVISVVNASGVATAINTYDEYGIRGSSNAGRFQYTGQPWLGEVSRYHYRARVYAQTVGRFMQTDPIGVGDGLNLYAYVLNNPTNAVDPLGLQTVTEGPEIVVRGLCNATCRLWQQREREEWQKQFEGPGRVFEVAAEEGAQCPAAGEGQYAQRLMPPMYARPVIVPRPNFPYPGSNVTNPPGPGFEWVGPRPVGTGRGSWFNRSTGESMRPDLAHRPPIGPHWDYTIRPTPTSPGGSYRWFPDGRITPKSGVLGVPLDNPIEQQVACA